VKIKDVESCFEQIKVTSKVGTYLGGTAALLVVGIIFSAIARFAPGMLIGEIGFLLVLLALARTWRRRNFLWNDYLDAVTIQIAKNAVMIKDDKELLQLFKRQFEPLPPEFRTAQRFVDIQHCLRRVRGDALTDSAELEEIFFKPDTL
jgi:hypothetical protein